jgi:hypothetical protein
MIKRDFIDDSQEISLIQNRLTAAGMILAILFFSGGFTVALYGQMAIEHRADYRAEFPQIAIAISLGATLTLLTIASLLVCQQLGPTAPQGRWFRSRRWWFAASTIWLYLALTQAMSAGLTEVVYGLSFKAAAVAWAMAIAATPVWLLLLLVAPIHLIMRLRSNYTPGENRALTAAFGVPLLLVILLPAEVYRKQDALPFSAINFGAGAIQQVVQPLQWPRSWKSDDQPARN